MRRKWLWSNAVLEHCKGDKYDFAFYGRSNFNADIAHWDVSHVTAFDNMFEAAVSFNQKISGWTTSSAWRMQCSVNRSHLITTFLDGILLLSPICGICSMEHCNSIKTYSNGLVLRLQRHKKICSLERLLSTTNTYVQSRTKCNRASRLSKAGPLRHQVNGCLPISTSTITITPTISSPKPVSDTNFRDAIESCLWKDSKEIIADGMCYSSEYGPMPSWDTSLVTNMSHAFSQYPDFNGYFRLDTSNVVT